MVKVEMSTETPKLLDAWLRQQERVKHIQSIQSVQQQQCASVEQMKQFCNYQQQLAAAWRTPVPVDPNMQQAFLFNLYFQVRFMLTLRIGSILI